MFLLLISVAFVAFPSKNDALLSANRDNLKIDVSGSIGLYHHGKCNPTHPNLTLIATRESDWCSNIAEGDNNNPWITYSISGKVMKLNGFAIRNGCCYYACCCNTETGGIIDYRCCCALYSFFVQGSNDNQTWKELYHVTKDGDYFHYCQYRHYDISSAESFRYVRFVLEESRPGCPRCMQINQIELYGQALNSFNVESYDDTDESVSIIGKVKRI